MKNKINTDRISENVNEFCAAVGIGRTRFYKDVAAGNIRIVKIGRKTLVPLTERNDYLLRMSSPGEMK